MPRIPKGAHFDRDLRTHVKRPMYPLVPEERLNPNPYYQCGLGFFQKELTVGTQRRNYGVYVPDGMISKGAAVVLFLPRQIKTEEFTDFENWTALSEKYHTALLCLECSAEGWTAEALEQDFDFAWSVVCREFSERLTVDICESYLYIIGLGDAAATAAAFALTYSATFAAFAADGDCEVDPELLDRLKELPSDGIDTRRKTEISMPGFVIDRSGNADALKQYLRMIVRSDSQAKYYNRYGEVYIEKPRRGEWFLNGQPTAQVWIGDSHTVADRSRGELNEAMLQFVLQWSLWGGFGNNHRRWKESSQQMGMRRISMEVDGFNRYFDVYVPSSYRPDDGKHYPLVVAIHGKSCNAEYFEKTSEWHRLAEERGFFVLYPGAYPYNDGLERFPVPHWAVNTMDVEPKDEVKYFRLALDTVENAYNIDPTRIYVAGHSNGGQMTQKLLRDMPEKFAAFSPTGALLGWREDQIEIPEHGIKCPVWIMMGEYDVADPNPEDGSMARKTIELYAQVNGAVQNYENWYDNGNYHTLSLYDDTHMPVVRYTIIRGCPHTYTPEMAQLAWDEWFCHFTREADGTIVYHG